MNLEEIALINAEAIQKNQYPGRVDRNRNDTRWRKLRASLLNYGKKSK